LALLCLMLVLSVAGCRGAWGSSEASCVAPSLTVASPIIAPGASVQVSGQFFVADCHDVTVFGQSPQPNTPLGSLDLMWTDSANSTHRLATVRPDAHGSIEATVRMPSTTPVGGGLLFVAGYGQPLAVQITG
jgi:hypothetical protein